MTGYSSSDAQENLRTLHEWFRSGDAYALIRAYENEAYRKAGTTGVLGAEKQKPSVIDERGILRSERFREYMMTLERELTNALDGSQNLVIYPESDKAIPLLLSTLNQMIGSVDLPDEYLHGSTKTLKQLFETGKQMARVIDAYALQTGQKDRTVSRGQFG